MRLTGKFYTLTGRPTEITLRIGVSGMPDTATVAVTDVQVQKGDDPTGLVPNPREAGTTATPTQRWVNGAINGDMVIVALSNNLTATPARSRIEGMHGDTAKVGDMHFGEVDGAAWADARTHDNSQGYGRPPTITERSDLMLGCKIGDTGDEWEPKAGARGHLRLSWIERE